MCTEEAAKIEGLTGELNTESILLTIMALKRRILVLKEKATDRDVRMRSRQLLLEVEHLPTCLWRKLQALTERHLPEPLPTADLQAAVWTLQMAINNLAAAAVLFEQDKVDADQARTGYSRARELINRMWTAVGEKWAEAPSEANQHFYRCQNALGCLNYEECIEEAGEAIRKGQAVIDHAPPLEPKAQQQPDWPINTLEGLTHDQC